jgi:hypothetical protein
LGKTKGRNNSDSCEEKGHTHASGAKKALPVNESSLGSKKESRRRKEGSCEEKGHTHGRRPKKAVRANESAVGSQKESCGEEVTSLSRLAL